MLGLERAAKLHRHQLADRVHEVVVAFHLGAGVKARGEHKVQIAFQRVAKKSAPRGYWYWSNSTVSRRTPSASVFHREGHIPITTVVRPARTAPTAGNKPCAPPSRFHTPGCRWRNHCSPLSKAGHAGVDGRHSCSLAPSVLARWFRSAARLPTGQSRHIKVRQAGFCFARRECPGRSARRLLPAHRPSAVTARQHGSSSSNSTRQDAFVRAVGHGVGKVMLLIKPSAPSGADHHMAGACPPGR